MNLNSVKFDFNRFFAVAAVGIVATAFYAGPAEAAALAAHRAVYDLKLDRADDGNGISDVNGRMVFEFVGNSCEGYTVNMRYRTNFANSEGKVAMSDIQSSTWESGDGASFSFTTRQFLGSNLTEETRGSASRPDQASDVSIKLTQPSEKSFAADATTMFPTQHFVALIDAALDGKRFLQIPVYDGSNEGDKIYDTSAVIGAAATRAAGESDEEITEDIKDLTVWPVSIAYFEEKQDGEQLPSYQISFDLFENGVSKKLVLDYGDFVLSGKLVSLEMLDDPGCEPEKNQ
ncbi:MAG: cell envelope integrity EipB family protein [Fimbriimonadaceae bacterium]|nr:cell envelope integrity EipB family protein [Alphaproteobacteria bacterium]